MQKERDIIVVKYGTSSICNDVGVDESLLEKHTMQIKRANEYYDLVVVTSGAVALGRTMWDRERNPHERPDDQSLATLGSAELVVKWQEKFADRGLLGAQLLVTHRELDDYKESSRMNDVLQKNRKKGVITIANENDAMSDVEIERLKIGADNDWLAARLAIGIGAKSVAFLTEAEGVYGPDGTLIRRVAPGEIISVGNFGLSKEGRGGMESKVAAARFAASMGVHADIASRKSAILGVVDSHTGTYFPAE